MTEGLASPVEAAHKYEILRVVNRGGMGEIALARVRGSKGFEKLVVLKRLRADAERDDHKEMFDVEAEVMSRIEHPNIVQVFDQPRIDGTQYLAMAYVRGRNLDQVIRRTRQQSARISPAFSLTVMGEVLRGLAFVHRLKDEQGRALGVVHQDITPSNILVSFFGETKLTDFGIAYVTSRDGGRRSGVLKGKPRYVSPEVLAGKRVNNRADIYGAGVVLYEMLAGRALFARPSLEETLAAVARNELPDFRVVFPSLGEGLFQVLHRSLTKDPNDRYRTAEEMHADVASELGRLGGAISAPRIGYMLRQWFSGDPDVPEVDPTLDAAISEPTPSSSSSAFKAPNLDQTLSELDRLLGGETSSADLFQLPPEIQRELDGLADMEPFAALTPIPEIALSGPNGEELLLRGMGVRSLDAPPSISERDFSPFNSKTPQRSILPPSSWPSPPPPPPTGSGNRAIPVTTGARLSPAPSARPSMPPQGVPVAFGSPMNGPSGFTPRPNIGGAGIGAAGTSPGIIPSGPGNLSSGAFTPNPMTEEEDGLSRSVTGAARRAQLRASRGEYRVTPRGTTPEVPNVKSGEPPPARLVPPPMDIPIEAPVNMPPPSLTPSEMSASMGVSGPLVRDQPPKLSFASGIAIGALMGAIAATAASFLLLR